MVAYEKSLQWQELFDLALCEKLSEEDIISMGYRVSGVYFGIAHQTKYSRSFYVRGLVIKEAILRGSASADRLRKRPAAGGDCTRSRK